MPVSASTCTRSIPGLARVNSVECVLPARRTEIGTVSLPASCRRVRVSEVGCLCTSTAVDVHIGLIMAMQSQVVARCSTFTTDW